MKPTSCANWETGWNIEVLLVLLPILDTSIDTSVAPFSFYTPSSLGKSHQFTQHRARITGHNPRFVGLARRARAHDDWPPQALSCRIAELAPVMEGQGAKDGHTLDALDFPNGDLRSQPASSDSDSDGSGAGETLHLSRYTTNISTTPERGYVPHIATQMSSVQVPYDQYDANDDGIHEEQHDSIAPLARSSVQNYSPTGYHSSSTSSPWTTQSYTTNPTPTSTYGWEDSRPRGLSGSNMDGISERTSASSTPKPERPGYSRTPSNAYAPGPARRPSQHPSLHSSSSNTKTRNSTNKLHRLNPDAEYRAQKKLYAQRLQRENADQESLLSPETYPPSLGHSSGTESDDESGSLNDYPEGDPYDQETLLYYGEETMPSPEELKVPANRERLEWHSMLENVLTGDVVRQEKKRITGVTDALTDKATLSAEIWLGVRAKCTGRTLPVQKKILEDQRTKIAGWIEDIVSFEIRGEAEVGKSPKQQVEEIVGLIEKCERLYPTRKAFEEAHPRAASDAYQESCDGLIAWHNTTALISTEIGILHAWVGNQELDFHKSIDGNAGDSALNDDATFIDRILKEDGLKQLQDERKAKEDAKDSKEARRVIKEKLNRERPMILHGINDVIFKAKSTLISNAQFFHRKHLPPYIEELLTLINFPSRLLAEIVSVRLTYAGRIKDPEKQNLMMAEQMISQFQVLLSLAVKIKSDYLQQAAPEPGWELPYCLDENFDETVLNALKYYFKMLGWKLSANRNSFKEAEILDQEWEFANALGRFFEGGDVEVAEQFRYVHLHANNAVTLADGLKWFDIAIAIPFDTLLRERIEATTQ